MYFWVQVSVYLHDLTFYYDNGRFVVFADANARLLPKHLTLKVFLKSRRITSTFKAVMAVKESLICREYQTLFTVFMTVIMTTSQGKCVSCALQE